MKIKLLTALLTAGFLYAAGLHAQTQTLYGVTDANTIFSISNPAMPSGISGPYSVTGVTAGQQIVAIGTRKSNGQLYVLGYDSSMLNGELYTISASGTTYTATAVSGTLASLNLGSTNNVAMSFVSTNDNEIRIVGRNGNNYLMSAANGTVMSSGTSGLSFGTGDVHVGTGILAATGYTNNFYGSDLTQEVGYDATNNVLVNMDAATFSNGFNVTSNTLHSIGITTGASFTLGGSVGMDTWYDTSAHNNVIYLSATPLLGSGAHLYSYNMSSGAGTITDLGAIGSGSLNVRDIAFATDSDSTSAITGAKVTGLSLNMRNLVFFDSHNPGNILKAVSLSGMATGQTMVGIDYSANGMLYGLGYNSISHTYQVYTIDTLSGNVTAVNATPYSLNLGTDDGSGNYINVGFRFIPTNAGRIRVVGNSGSMNVELDAATGAILTTDTALQYVSGDASFGTTPLLTSLAYTGYAGDTTTQMFGYDAGTGNLIKFDATNGTAGYGAGSSGYINTDVTLTPILNLLLHTSGYNNSFMNITYDEASASNTGYIAANYVGDSSLLLNYSILYDMSGMLTGYHRGTASTPTETGAIGYGTPVKDIALMRSASVTTLVPFNANTNSNDLLVYPNPVIDQTTVELGVASISNVYVDVIDMNGNIDRKQQFNSGSDELLVDMSHLPVGLYSLRVYGKGIGAHNLKVVKME